VGLPSRFGGDRLKKSKTRKCRQKPVSVCLEPVYTDPATSERASHRRRELILRQGQKKPHKKHSVFEWPAFQYVINVGFGIY
jgi:hypothetical protein